MLKFKPYASGSKGNMYLLSNEETKILVECGINKEKLRSNLIADGLIITDINACVITHQHT